MAPVFPEHLNTSPDHGDFVEPKHSSPENAD